ncbi:hypothetical protein AB0J28_22100 [Streptosporangium canum]|uniref:hypothetical protein n=1 Tax=Streptosporangium canum TaxID=324952 RepID=UPI0034182DFA
MKVPLTPASPPGKTSLAFILACQMLTLGACGGQAYWDQIPAVTVSAEELTLTAELTIGPPKVDGTSCYEVVNREVDESASKVTIGVQMRNNCASFFPWEEERSNLAGYPLKVDLHLKTPLAGRSVLDKKSSERVTIIHS